MDKSELLDLACANATGDTVLEKALQRYNTAAAEMTQQAGWLATQADLALMRVNKPSRSPTLDTSIYTNVAVRLAVAEQAAWQALFDIAVALQDAGHDVNW
jgi:hypothetical protein